LDIGIANALISTAVLSRLGHLAFAVRLVPEINQNERGIFPHAGCKIVADTFVLLLYSPGVWLNGTIRDDR